MVFSPLWRISIISGLNWDMNIVTSCPFEWLFLWFPVVHHLPELINLLISLLISLLINYSKEHFSGVSALWLSLSSLVLCLENSSCPPCSLCLSFSSSVQGVLWCSLPCTMSYKLSQSSELGQWRDSLCSLSHIDHYPLLPDVQYLGHHHFTYF